AEAAFQKGALDEAANQLDALVSEGERGPYRLNQPAPWVAASVLRVSVALARGETALAGRLLDRLLRFNPDFSFLPEEESPRLQAALNEARGRLTGRPSLNASDLGEACQAAEVVVVGRALGDRVDVQTWEHCTLVGSTEPAAPAPLPKVVVVAPPPPK